jgi:hypothetical protein
VLQTNSTKTLLVLMLCCHQSYPIVVGQNFEQFTKLKNFTQKPNWKKIAKIAHKVFV